MKRILLTGILLAFLEAHAVEIGAKFGNTRINWKGINDSTTLEWYIGVYGEYMFPVGPSLNLGPNVEIGYGKKNVGAFYCDSNRVCTVDLTYTTLEVNAKAILDVSPMFEIFGGAGVSSNRFGLDARDTSTGRSVGALADETGGGFQAFVGAQLTIKGFGVGLEYKYKAVDTSSIKSVDVVTLNFFFRL